MNKKEVAAFLGKSERTVAVYVEKGRLTREFESKNGISHAVFNRADVEKLKAEIDNESRPSTVVKGEAAPTSRDAAPVTPNILSTVQPTLAAGQGSVDEFADALAERLNKGRNLSQTNLAAQMLLSVPEAMILSGLKEKPIRDAIKAGHLKSVRIGRSVQVRPADLQKWVDSQF